MELRFIKNPLKYAVICCIYYRTVYCKLSLFKQSGKFTECSKREIVSIIVQGQINLWPILAVISFSLDKLVCLTWETFAGSLTGVL